MSGYRSIWIACIAAFSFVALATGGAAQTPQPPPDEALQKAQQQRDEAMRKAQKSADDINKFIAEQEGQQNGPSNAKQSGPPKGGVLIVRPAILQCGISSTKPQGLCAIDDTANPGTGYSFGAMCRGVGDHRHVPNPHSGE